MKYFFSFLSIVFLSLNSFSQSSEIYDAQYISNESFSPVKKQQPNLFRKTLKKKSKEEKKHNKLTAVAFSLLLGHFGGHRLYLGTDEKIPIMYTVTLGGGLILPFIDTIFIIVSKDLSKFEDNENFFIWTPKSTK